MSVSCDTGTATVEFEGAACRLEAVFLYRLHMFVHLWALAHVVPFWSHPSHATKGYHQWCRCPQPLAPVVSPGGGLGPRGCATCAAASGDFPPWRSRRTLTRFSTSPKMIHVVDPKMRPQKFAPLKLIVGGAQGYAMVPEPPQVGPREPCGTPSVYTHACKILSPRFAHQLPTFSSYLIVPHTRML